MDLRILRVFLKDSLWLILLMGVGFFVVALLLPSSDGLETGLCIFPWFMIMTGYQMVTPRVGALRTLPIGQARLAILVWGYQVILIPAIVGLTLLCAVILLRLLGFEYSWSVLWICFFLPGISAMVYHFTFAPLLPLKSVVAGLCVFILGALWITLGAFEGPGHPIGKHAVLVRLGVVLAGVVASFFYNLQYVKIMGSLRKGGKPSSASIRKTAKTSRAMSARVGPSVNWFDRTMSHPLRFAFLAGLLPVCGVLAFQILLVVCFESGYSVKDAVVFLSLLSLVACICVFEYWSRSYKILISLPVSRAKMTLSFIGIHFLFSVPALVYVPFCFWLSSDPAAFSLATVLIFYFGVVGAMLLFSSLRLVMGRAVFLAAIFIWVPLLMLAAVHLSDLPFASSLGLGAGALFVLFLYVASSIAIWKAFQGDLLPKKGFLYEIDSK